MLRAFRMAEPRSQIQISDGTWDPGNSASPPVERFALGTPSRLDLVLAGNIDECLASLAAAWGLSSFQLKFSMGGADPCAADVTLVITDVVSFFTFCWPTRDNEQQALGDLQTKSKNHCVCKHNMWQTCDCCYLDQWFLIGEASSEKHNRAEIFCS